MRGLILLFSFLLSVGLSGQKIYDYDWKKEVSIVAGAGLMVGSSYYIDSKREPLVAPPLGSDLPLINGLDRGALGNYSTAAKGASDVLFYGVTLAPLCILASGKLKGNKLGYLLMYGEVVALNGGITFLVKSVVNRKRPYFYNDAAPIAERQSLDARKSFFSGHASHTAALSFFAARVFTDLYPSSDWRYLVWGGAVVIPATTAYLRVRAGRHYTTDVLVGYGVGAAVGLLVPHLHRVQVSDTSHASISGGSKGIQLTLVF